ncbi:SemiSWEET family transporter [Spiroplasma endosymbiont of Stenodema calcarata]|uniref:SemiSWEET family transporter n=1 Tax=Spiroplasma endosymbiont of Stenodema calcarata TaxID=3139328 RepID=UPI003CCAF43C
MIPQSLKTIIKKDTISISLLMLILYLIGNISWITYGFILCPINLVLIVSNLLQFIFANITLILSKTLDEIKKSSIWQFEK